MAEYSSDLQAVRWNATFERFFPEHAGRIHVGEAYAANLRRFYQARLQGEDLRQIDRLIREGIQRHLTQAAPFEFSHHGRTLRVACVPLDDGRRIRIWKEVLAPHGPGLMSTPAFDALEKLAEGACVLDVRHRIVTANERFRALYDVIDGQPLVGSTLDEVVANVWGSGAPLAMLRATIRNGLRYDGAPFLVELPGDRWRRVVTRHADRDHAYLIHGDVTADQRLQRELRTLADHDGLTGLMNRRAFDEQLARCSRGALLLLDADHFKQINDRHGHLVGDTCLRRIADDLLAEARAENGHAARLGGEEFAVLVPNLELKRASLLAERIRNRICDTAHRPVVTVSVGVAAGNARLLQAAADRALYRAKTQGRNRTELARSAWTPAA